MGLDMYLHKRSWIGVEARKQLTMNGLPDGVEPSKVTYVIQDAGYWRKANAIHRWFVENVQDGQDDCHTYEVSREQLRSLLGQVEAVLVHPDMAARLLPTQSGFFFGTTEYGQDYIDDLKDTRRIVSEALADTEAVFEYSSSW